MQKTIENQNIDVAHEKGNMDVRGMSWVHVTFLRLYYCCGKVR